MSLLILMRHGQSMWNAAKLFTGWVDVPLTPKGIDEARDGGRAIAHLPIDEVHVSTLIRAQMTAMIALSEHGSGKTPVFQYPTEVEDGMSENETRMREWAQIRGDAGQDNLLPVHVAWQLNERMYGDLQGLNKDATRETYGAEQVHIWRRSYDVPPPNGESLELTAARTIPYLESTLIPAIDGGKNVFVAAHGNSLRSIIMHLDGLSKEEVLGLEVPTGVPIVYERTEAGWQRLKRRPLSAVGPPSEQDVMLTAISSQNGGHGQRTNRHPRHASQPLEHRLGYATSISKISRRERMYFPNPTPCFATCSRPKRSTSRVVAHHRGGAHWDQHRRVRGCGSNRRDIDMGKVQFLCFAGEVLTAALEDEATGLAMATSLMLDEFTAQNNEMVGVWQSIRGDVGCGVVD